MTSSPLIFESEIIEGEGLLTVAQLTHPNGDFVVQADVAAAKWRLYLEDGTQVGGDNAFTVSDTNAGLKGAPVILSDTARVDSYNTEGGSRGYNLVFWIAPGSLVDADADAIELGQVEFDFTLSSGPDRVLVHRFRALARKGVT